MPTEKVFASCAAAVADIPYGATILVSGAAVSGDPSGLIGALARTSTRGLTCIYSPLGCPPSDGCPCPSSPGIDPLLANGQVSRLVSAFPFVSGASSFAEECWRTGALEIEVVPQGILAERLRAGGAGLGGVFLPPADGTRFANGKETRVLEGRETVFEPALKANFAFVRAAAADTFGNVIYRGIGRNLGPTMAMASTVCIAEVDHISEPGSLDPEVIISGGIFVNRIVQTTAP